MNACPKQECILLNSSVFCPWSCAWCNKATFTLIPIMYSWLPASIIGMLRCNILAATIAETALAWVCCEAWRDQARVQVLPIRISIYASEANIALIKRGIRLIMSWDHGRLKAGLPASCVLVIGPVCSNPLSSHNSDDIQCGDLLFCKLHENQNGSHVTKFPICSRN